MKRLNGGVYLIDLVEKLGDLTFVDVKTINFTIKDFGQPITYKNILFRFCNLGKFFEVALPLKVLSLDDSYLDLCNVYETELLNSNGNYIMTIVITHELGTNYLSISCEIVEKE